MDDKILNVRTDFKKVQQMCYNIKRTVAALSNTAAQRNANEAQGNSRLYSRSEPDSKSKAVMRIVVSLVMLLSGLAIIFAPPLLFSETPDGPVRDAAFGWIGAVLGYWLG